MKTICYLYKASGIEWFLQKEALFLGSSLLTYNNTPDCVNRYWAIMQNIPFISHKTTALLAASAQLLMFCANSMSGAEQQLWSSWNTSFDLIFSLLPTPRSFKSTISICCSTSRCSPSYSVHVVAPKLSPTNDYRDHKHGLTMWNHTYTYSLPKYPLRKFTKSFGSLVRKFLLQPTPLLSPLLLCISGAAL